MASLIVFEASDPSRSTRRRLRRAAAARAQVQHPNLVRTRMAGAVNGSVQVALPRHLAPTLRESLETGPLHPLECVVLVDGLAQGSKALAQAGLTPRNFTPDKVLVDPVRGGILADSGIPPELLKREPRESDPDLPYRSPEELQRHPLDSRSAVYSLGALLFTALTGAAPFSGAWADIYQAHFAGARPQPTSLRPVLPEEIDAVIARAMAVDPSDRYASPAELARAAATALGDSPAWETFGESAASSGRCRRATRATGAAAAAPPRGHAGTRGILGGRMRRPRRSARPKHGRGSSGTRGAGQHGRPQHGASLALGAHPRKPGRHARPAVAFDRPALRRLGGGPGRRHDRVAGGARARVRRRRR